MEHFFEPIAQKQPPRVSSRNKVDKSIEDFSDDIRGSINRTRRRLLLIINGYPGSEKQITPAITPELIEDVSKEFDKLETNLTAEVQKIEDIKNNIIEQLQRDIQNTPF